MFATTIAKAATKARQRPAMLIITQARGFSAKLLYWVVQVANPKSHNLGPRLRRTASQASRQFAKIAWIVYPLCDDNSIRAVTR